MKEHDAAVLDRKPHACVVAGFGQRPHDDADRFGAIGDR
jgi:hypothetical protein